MRNSRALRVGEAIVQTFWAGALWTVGYMVAPALFKHLDSADAGRIAGELFSVVAWISMLCGIFLLIAIRAARGFGGTDRLRAWLISAMMILMAVSEWVIRPLMVASRLADGSPGDDFAMWHGVSAVLYLIASLAGILLVSLAGGGISGSRVQSGD